MALCLRALAVLADELDLILSSQLSVTPFPGGSGILFWHLQTLPHSWCTERQAGRTLTCIPSKEKEGPPTHPLQQPTLVPKKNIMWAGGGGAGGIPEDSGAMPL